MRYRVLLHESDEGVGVIVPGLPGCSSQGATEAEAIANIKIAIAEYLSVVAEQTSGHNVREIEITV
jgi:predicted RNase H-like HicB family nuclease